MTEEFEDLTISYFEDGVETVKELDKVVLSKGAWSTLLFKYCEWDAKLDKYGPEKYSIRRYQKRFGEYKMKSKFNISSPAQARKIIEALNGWLEEVEEA